MRKACVELSQNDDSVFAGLEICHNEMDRDGRGEAMERTVAPIELHEPDAVSAHRDTLVHATTSTERQEQDVVKEEGRAEADEEGEGTSRECSSLRGRRAPSLGGEAGSVERSR
jgi:hypothetical protein